MHQELGKNLKKILNLDRDPVALKWVTKPPSKIQKLEGRKRFCTKLEKAMHGEIFYSTLEEEECMGGAKYTGLKDSRESAVAMRSGEFLIPMGVYQNVPAVQRAWRSYLHIEPGIFQSLIFAPLIEADYEPDVIFLVCLPRQAMEILHANAYDSGAHGLGADAAPICSSMAALPYLTGKITYGFGDIGARNNMQLQPEEVMVSIPANELVRIVRNLEEMRTKSFFRKVSEQ